MDFWFKSLDKEFPEFHFWYKKCLTAELLSIALNINLREVFKLGVIVYPK